MEYTSDNEMSSLSLNDSNDRSDSESTHSTPEDERIKRLFFTCDTNGDGFITYEDIRQVCIQLEMEYCVEEIMRELGTDANGRISYSDFVKRRSELLEVKHSDSSEDNDSTISESKEPLLDESSQASSFEMSSVTDEQHFGSQQNRSVLNDNRQIWGQKEVTTVETETSGLSNTEGWLQYKRHDSWEFDSGTHDLEVDTISLQKQIEASGIEMPSNINELLDLANRYYIESINNIKQEKSRIHSQLKSILREHEFLQKQILSLKEEKISIIKDLEKKKLRERMEYEDKITELQSIIGELSQNLNYYQFLTIKEEEDECNERENEISEQNTSGLNVVSNKKDSLESNFESNLNLKIEVMSDDKEIGKQNELILSETENVNNRRDSDRYESDDSHATALEIDRLECRISYLETQIDLSALHLNQSKESAERLTVLLGKYDANNTALELALNYSDKALEITDLLVGLLQTEIGLVLVNCRAAGLGKNVDLSESEEKEEVMRIYELATHKRKVTEESALDYLTKNCTEFDLSGETFSREHENKLRDILNQLKEEKSIVRSSVTKLEPFVEDSDKELNPMPDSTNPNPNLNIESIVLMQDLVAIKEMNASLRSQIYSLQKENSLLVQQIIRLKQKIKNRIDFEDNDQNIPQKGSEYGKESKDSDPFTIDLRRANSDLNEELERIKRKYSIKIKKLEQKIASMSQKNSAHVKILQNKISLLENSGSFRSCIETTL